MLNVRCPEPQPVLRRLAVLCALAGGALLTAGCGGGDRAEPYVPQKMVSFGDENSLIASDQPSGLTLAADGTTPATVKGLVYTVNGLTAVYTAADGAGNPYLCTDPASTAYTACDATNGVAGTLATFTNSSWYLDAAYANSFVEVRHGATAADTATSRHMDLSYIYSCSGASIWTQVVAHGFKLGYSRYNGAEGQCPSDQYSNAVTYAAYGARVADVVQQVNTHQGELAKGTLVTVMAGQWDIYDAYIDITQNAVAQSVVEARLQASAADLASAVIQAVNTGAKVVLALTPDLGESPLAYNASQRTLLKSLTLTFNNALYIHNIATRVTDGGRVVAGVNTELLTNTSTRSTAYTYAPSVVCPEADTYTTTTTTDGSGNTTTTESGNTLKDPVGNRVKADGSFAGYDRFQA
ncbi:MAG: hypothetical protein RI907_867, partial [Pseudomonadota bacterium]